MDKKIYSTPKCKLIELGEENMLAGSDTRNRVPSNMPAHAGRNSTETYSLEDEEDW